MGNTLKTNQSVPSKPKKQLFLQAYYGKSIQPADNLLGNVAGIQVHGEQQYLSSEVSLAESTGQGS